MSAPQGYTALDFVGFTDKGEYDATATYVQNDLVRYNYDIWKCTTDDTTGETPSVGSPYWTVFIETGNGETVQAQIADIVNVYGSKNLLRYPYYESSHTESGITFTDNGDGTVTANGTATANSDFIFVHQSSISPTYPTGDLILSGCPSGGSNDTYKMYYQPYSGGTPGAAYADMGDGIIFPASDEVKTYTVRIRIVSGTTVSNLVFKPMIRCASVSDDTWVPYRPTNAKLDEEKVSYDDVAESVQKNLLPYPFHDTTRTTQGITYTDLGDGTVRANGTATANTTFELSYQIEGVNLIKSLGIGRYVVNGCPDGGSASTYFMRFTWHSISGNNWITLCTDIGNGSEVFEITNAILNDMDLATLNIRVYSGTTVNNLIFKPMLRKATIKDDTWEPYIPNNTELVSWKANGVLGAKNLIPYPYYDTTVTRYGITFTDNGDGSVKVNGTNDNSYNSDFMLMRKTILKAGTYKLSFDTSTPITSEYCRVIVDFYSSDDTTFIKAVANTNGQTFTISKSDAQTYTMRCYIRIYKGKTITNLTFKPMIRLAEDTDDTYQPYAMSNRELTDVVTAMNVSNIPTNADLNDYYIVGEYNANSGSLVASLSNKPSDLTSAFQLRVLNRGYKVGEGVADSNITQIIESINNNVPVIYMRNKPYSSTWGDWYKFTGTVVS